MRVVTGSARVGRDVARRETRWSKEGLWAGEGRKEEEGPEWEGQ